MDISELLDTTKGAQYVGCSPATIRYRMRYCGLEPSAYLGRAPFFTKDDLDEHFALLPFRR